MPFERSTPSCSIYKLRKRKEGKANADFKIIIILKNTIKVEVMLFCVTQSSESRFAKV
jgi:hypothetical protein